MGKYIPHKEIIYLDQFALSRLVDSEPGSIWEKLNDLLQEGVEMGRIVVPYANDHLIESSTSDIGKAVKEDAFLFELSKGVMLEIEPEIAARLLIYKVRNQRFGLGAFTTSATHNGFNSKEEIARYAGLRQQFDKMVDEGTGMLNMLRDATRVSKGQGKKGEKTSLEIIVAMYEKHLRTRLKIISRYGFYDKEGIKFSFIQIPFWADTIMDLLIEKYRITKDEARKAENLLGKEGLINTMPTHYVRAVLETMMMIKHQKEKVNDHIDIIRLSTAIPFCDIVLTDKIRQYDAKNFKLHSYFKTEIYSGTAEQLNMFANRLSEIIHTSGH
ncbi:MAG: hypothetical protein IPK31_09130 [Chitinophagaceae bacterium]|nr:hypothetical protein [Chitinophagaceae bacterium]